MHFKELSKDVDYSDNSFDFTTPVGKNKLKFKLLTGADERLIEKDLEQNTEFRIKYPRGDLGKSSGEAELFMLVEDLYKSVEKMEKILESNMTNKVNIDFLSKQVEKMATDIEKLKDKQRDFANGDHK